MSAFNKKLFLNNVYAILKEAVHDANIGRYGSVGSQSPKSSDQTLGGIHLKGGNTYPYISPPTTVSGADELDDSELDDAIEAIASKTNGSSSSLPIIDPNNQRTDKRSLGGNPVREQFRNREIGYSTSSVGMVTPASRALNSPKGNKGTAMGGQNTQINTRRPTGSIRDFSAGTKDLNQDVLDEPVYDLSDILVHKDGDRSNIDRLKKLTWILQKQE